VRCPAAPHQAADAGMTHHPCPHAWLLNMHMMSSSPSTANGSKAASVPSSHSPPPPPPLARLMQAPVPASWARAWEARASQLLPQLTVRQASNMLWAAARIGLRPKPGLLAQLQSRLVDGMQDCNAQDMANALWALARLGAQPTGAWWSTYSAQATAIAHTFKAQEVANTVWAYAKLGARPPEVLLAGEAQLAAAWACLGGRPATQVAHPCWCLCMGKHTRHATGAVLHAGMLAHLLLLCAPALQHCLPAAARG